MSLSRLFVGAGALFVVAGIGAAGISFAQDEATSDGQVLKPAASFASIADTSERSQALFTEAGKVILHPRCLNCHPATDRPTQGMTMHPHMPPVSRGEGDMGMPGMLCSTCHGQQNVTLVGQADTIKSIPGNPAWHLAPIEMAWQGKTLGQICEQLKDPARNGNRDLAAIVEHMAKDDLVGWGWHPGEGREPVPGTQQAFGELIQQWVDTGAACPKS